MSTLDMLTPTQAEGPQQSMDAALRMCAAHSTVPGSNALPPTAAMEFVLYHEGQSCDMLRLTGVWSPQEHAKGLWLAHL